MMIKIFPIRFRSNTVKEKKEEKKTLSRKMKRVVVSKY